MGKVTIDRELLERLACEVVPTTHQELLNASDDFGAAIKELRAILSAPRQTAGDPHKHEAQPEVAQNTGSRSMTNKLSSQGRTGCTGVEGVAAPCETPDAVDIFAWATFDGEGSHDLRLYEDNENYRDDFRAANPALHPDWVFPLCRLSDAQAIIDGLRGEVADLRSMLATVSKAGLRGRTERDQQAQRIGELEELLRGSRKHVAYAADHCEQAGMELDSIDAALSAGK